MRPSLTPRFCSWCRRTHIIGDARGPGYCPSDSDHLLFDERSVSDNDLPDSEFQKKYNGPKIK